MTVLITRLLIIFFFITTFNCIADNKAIAQQVETMAKLYDKKYSTVKHITVADYLKNKKKWVLIDVRPANERKVSMIPGAVTVKQLKSKLIQHKSRPLLLYCTIGERSSAYALKLQTQGWEQVANLRGGVLAWALAGQSFLTSDNKKTKKVHVYGSAWNLLPANYIGVW